MFSFLKKVFRFSKSGSKSKRHYFDPNVIKARVINYHMIHHLAPDEKVDIYGCHLEYKGGDMAVIGVPFIGKNHKGIKLYLYDFSTGKIHDDTGEISMPQ